MSRKAKAQWSDPATRATILEGIRRTAPTRLRGLELVTYESFKRQKPDGRWYRQYREGGRSVMLHRARWVWMQAN